MWDQQSSMKGNKVNGINYPTYEVNLGSDFWENGFYYFAVSAVGDGISFSDSPYVLSDAFEYTGEDASPLPTVAGLKWKLLEMMASMLLGVILMTMQTKMPFGYVFMINLALW